MPLIGGKLEKLLAEQVTAGIEAEQRGRASPTWQGTLMSTQPHATTMTYDAPLAEVGAMLDDPAYRDEVMRAPRAASRGTFEIGAAPAT